MNDLTTFNLANSTAKIKKLTNQTAESIIEIGKEMLQVKVNLSYGEFTKWLENEVNYSQRTAYNFMKIAQTFPDLQPVANLGTRKLLALAGLDSDEEREKILKENNIEEMTIKELEEKIKIEKKIKELDVLISNLKECIRKHENMIVNDFDYGTMPLEQVQLLEELAKTGRQSLQDLRKQYIESLIEIKEALKNEKLAKQIIKDNIIEEYKYYIENFLIF